MLDPTALYRLEADGDDSAPGTPVLYRPGPLILALGAFVDAGQTQQLLSGHLLATCEPKVVASFDVDQVLDYRARRPPMVFEANKFASYSDPALLLYRMRDRSGATFYLLHGPEPDYQWERVTEAIGQLIDHFGVTMVVSAHGIPMSVPHTRPLGLTAHATRPELIGGIVSPFGTVQVPSGLSSLVEYRLGEKGKDAVGYAVHVPQYLAQGEYHAAALTALNAVVDVTGLNLPNDALVSRVGQERVDMSKFVADNDEVHPVLAQLEKSYDEFVSDPEQGAATMVTPTPDSLPSAEQLGADVEAFLRHLDMPGEVANDPDASEPGQMRNREDAPE